MTVSKLYNCKQCNWYVAINFCFVFSLVYGINTAFLPCIKTFPFSETRIKNAFKRICQSFRTSAEQARRYQVRSNYVLRAWYYSEKLSSPEQLRSKSPDTSEWKVDSVARFSDVNAKAVFIQDLRWSFCWTSNEIWAAPSPEFQEPFPSPQGTWGVELPHLLTLIISFQ